MRFTTVLRAQHLDFMFKRHWLVQGKRRPKDSGAKAILEAQGKKVIDAVEYINPIQQLPRVDLIGYLPKPAQLDESINCLLDNDRKCFTFSDSNVLLEGMQQAQVLTNTKNIENLPNSLQNSINNLNITNKTISSIQNSILTSNVYDAEQKKLAKIKDPNRPAFNFPRQYGITDSRRNILTINKLVQECEKLAGRDQTAERNIVNNVFFNVPFKKDKELIQIEVQVESFLISKRPIKPVEYLKEYDDIELPSLFPLKSTISMEQKNIYKHKNIYPIESNIYSPHTIYLHYSPLDVKNLHETEITDSQFRCRSLLKSFAVAVANARQKYGEDITGELPKPIVVQSIQTDGRTFYFGIFQLNSLDLDGNQKNLWFDIPKMDLFSQCQYQSGRPILLDYNNDVVCYLNGFYQNN